jgi:hypothetical protein
VNPRVWSFWIDAVAAEKLSKEIVLEDEDKEPTDEVVPDKPPDGGAAVNTVQVVNMGKHGKTRKNKKRKK